MSPKKTVPSLTCLSYSALGDYLRSYVRVVSSRSFDLIVACKKNSSFDDDECEAGFKRRDVGNEEQPRPGPSEALKRENFRSLQRVSSLRGLKYKAPVEEYGASPASQAATNLESCGRFIDDEIDRFHDLTFNSIPWYCHQRLAEVFLQVLGESATACKLLYRKWDEAHLYLHHVQVTIRFVRIILNSRVHSLDLSKLPRALRVELCIGISTLTGLETLNFGMGAPIPSASSMNSPSDVANLSQYVGIGGKFHKLWMAMRCLSKLKSLTLNNDCRNETITVLGQNCPELSYLDISGSHSVSDIGASWLLHCRLLEQANLYQTSIGVEGYAQLLLGLPKLFSIGRCDKFGQILEYIARGQNPNISLTNSMSKVRVCHSRDMSHHQLRLLSNMCPFLTNVSIYVDEDMGDLLTPLTVLEQLRELKLLACNFYNDRVDALLLKSGHRLHTLHLEHIDELDMNALCCIADTCINLEKLVFFSCIFVDNFGISIVDRLRYNSFRGENYSPETSSDGNIIKYNRNRGQNQENQVLPFRKLENLVCISETAPNVIEFLLVSADKLRFIQFGSTAWFNDTTVINILDRGALKQIEEIRILRSYELTMRAVNLLIEECPNLTLLSEMDGWEGISEEELRELRDKIKSNNLDLDTFSTWSVISN